MRGSIRLMIAGALLGLAAPAAAQEAGTFHVFVTGGLQTSPASYDSFRPVEYDAGVQFGGGLSLQINEVFALRGEVLTGSNSGFEGGVLNEDIEFDRTYYGLALEASTAFGSLMPFVYGGGGYVDIDRTGPSYGFSLTEAAAQGGVGIRMPIGASGLDAFGQAGIWAYPNTSTGDAQIDPLVNIGLGYTLPI